MLGYCCSIATTPTAHNTLHVAEYTSDLYIYILGNLIGGTLIPEMHKKPS